jgi:hypothetical protein
MADGGAVQWGLDGLLTVLLTIGGAVVKALRDDHKDLRKDHDDLVAEVPRTYARRDDVKASYDSLKSDISSMNDKLDRLIERRYGGP